MTKKMMLLAASALAALAFAALPALASAASVDGVTGQSFKGTFGLATLTSSNGNVECEGENHVKGSFASSTTGSIHLLFTNCKSSGVKCKSSGLAAGEITVEGEFHVINIEKETAGLLITVKPLTFTCSFLATIEVKGNVIGDVTAPKCGGTSAKTTLSFTSSALGVQTYQQIETTGTKYHLESNLNGGAFSESSEDVVSTTELASGEGTLTC